MDEHPELRIPYNARTPRYGETFHKLTTAFLAGIQSLLCLSFAQLTSNRRKPARHIASLSGRSGAWRPSSIRRPWAPRPSTQVDFRAPLSPVPVSEPCRTSCRGVFTLTIRPPIFRFSIARANLLRPAIRSPVDPSIPKYSTRWTRPPSTSLPESLFPWAQVSPAQGRRVRCTRFARNLSMNNITNVYPQLLTAKRTTGCIHPRRNRVPSPANFYVMDRSLRRFRAPASTLHASARRSLSMRDRRRTFCCNAAGTRHRVDKSTGVRSDQTVILTAQRLLLRKPIRTRCGESSYVDAETNKRLKFLTNNSCAPGR